MLNKVGRGWNGGALFLTILIEVNMNDLKEVDIVLRKVCPKCEFDNHLYLSESHNIAQHTCKNCGYNLLEWLRKDEIWTKIKN